MNPLSFDKTAFIFLSCTGTTSASKQRLPYSRRPLSGGGERRGAKPVSLVLAEPAVVQGDGFGCF